MTEEIQYLSLKMDELIKVLTPPTLLADLAFWGNVVLIITLLVLIWYTIETHRIANQTKESNLRPVILRSGFVENWDDVKFTFEGNELKAGKFLEFTILKNIATSINGYIIKNGLKFDLLFANDVSKIEENKFSFQPNWGWMKTDTRVVAIFKEENGIESKKPNQIVIKYQDIEGNKYFTIEDENFDQKVFRGMPK